MILRLLAFLWVASSIVACQKDDASQNPDRNQGALRLELTDSPLDNPEIDYVVITLRGVSLEDRQMPELSQALSVDISNYTEGQSIQVGTEQLLAPGFYSGLKLRFDAERDQEGQTPGAYLMMKDGSKQALSFGGQGVAEILRPDTFRIFPSTTTRVVIDFDLRKALSFDSATQQYSFLPPQSLQSAIRLIDEQRTGRVEGQLQSPMADSLQGLKFVVYAYPEGQFEATELRTGMKKSVSSTHVNSAGRFKLAFLPEGLYELVVLGYEDSDNDGRVELRGQYVADDLIGSPTRLVQVSAGADTQVRISMGQRLP